MLVALSVVLPLLAVLADLVWMRQRQASGFRERVGGQAAVRGALDVAMARLSSRRIVLAREQEERFSLEEAGSRPVHVRVTREPDAVVTVEGRVLRSMDVPDPALDPDAIDDEARVLGEFRRLEVYLVEAECASPRPFGAVRLLAVLGRLQPEGVVPLGIRYDRGYGP